MPRDAKVGPKGGTTTVTPGGYHKIQIYLDEESYTALREEAFKTRRTASEIIREELEERYERQGKG